VSSISTSVIVFGFVFGGPLRGMLLRKRLPKDHLSEDSKNVVNMGMDLVATMTAIVLGLLMWSAKSSGDQSIPRELHFRIKLRRGGRL
jgi:hypothetical protein